MRVGREAHLLFHTDCVGFYLLLWVIHDRGENVEWYWQVDSTFVPLWLDAGHLFDLLYGLILKPCHAYILTFLIASLQQVSLKFCICMSLTGREDWSERKWLWRLAWLSCCYFLFHWSLLFWKWLFMEDAGTTSDAHDHSISVGMTAHVVFTARQRAKRGRGQEHLGATFVGPWAHLKAT